MQCIKFNSDLWPTPTELSVTLFVASLIYIIAGCVSKIASTYKSIYSLGADVACYHP